MTDAQYLAWLASDSRCPCLLVEVAVRVGGVETTRYLSSTGYTTGATDTPANMHYDGVINGGGAIREQMSLTGGGGMAFGDIEIDNLDGTRDGWLDDVWANRVVRVYAGDQRWARADFRLILDGITADLDSRDRHLLNLKVRDKLQRLNTAVTSMKLGGASANADRLLPLVFGEVHNITPLLIDKALLKFQVHNGAIERIIEVRDNGVPVATTNTLGTGTFVLNASPAGTITASVQGDKPSTYSNTVAALVQRLVTGYGTDPFVAGDLDAANLAAFAAVHTQPIGLPLNDQDNVLSVAQQIAASVGAQVTMTATGTLRLLKIALPATGTPTAVGADMMFANTLQVIERLAVVAAVKIGYCRNWTVQASLQTGIPAEHKDLYGQEWLTSTAIDAAVATVYKLPTDVKQEDTLLQVKSDADAEATRKLALWEVQRQVLRYEGTSELLLEQLGGYQTLTDDRFGLAGGKSGQIVSIERDWLKGRVAVEVLV